MFKGEPMYLSRKRRCQSSRVIMEVSLSLLQEEVHELWVDNKIMVILQHMVISFHDGTLELKSGFTVPHLENGLLT